MSLVLANIDGFEQIAIFRGTWSDRQRFGTPRRSQGPDTFADTFAETFVGGRLGAFTRPLEGGHGAAPLRSWAKNY